MTFDIVILAKVKVHASVIEGELLQIGSNPRYSGFNGASEFRALTDEELKHALRLIEIVRDV
jgi:hypothetical protein